MRSRPEVGEERAKLGPFTPDEIDIIERALSARICYLETGCNWLTAQDIKNMGGSCPEGEIKALSLEAMKEIVAVDAIRTRVRATRMLVIR